MPVTRLVPPQDWPTLGWEFIAWSEHYLCHGPGDIQFEPLRFDDEFVQISLDVYRLFPQDHPMAGRRVVTYGCVSMPKGRAKSEWAGAVGSFELRGPCRFDGWNAAGEPVGKPITYPFLRCLATEETQTGNTYGNIITMLEHARDKFGSEWGFDQLDTGTSRILVGPKGKLGECRPSTAGGASKDGGKESWACADEPHLYTLPELRTMHSMVRRNSRKRYEAQPWMLGTTTMFKPGEGSVAEDLYEEAEKLQATTRRSYSFCWHHREGLPVKDPDDDGALIASLTEAYGPAARVPANPDGYVDVVSIMDDEIRAPGSVWAENVRYFLNLKHKGENKAIDPVRWDLMKRPQRNNITGQEIVLWFDGSDKGRDGDHTVLGAWLVHPQPHLVLIDSWGPEKMVDGEWKIDRRKVRKRVTELRTEFGPLIRRFVCDPHKWIEQCDEWEDEFGLDTNGDPIVLRFDTSKPSKMGPAIDRLLEAFDEEAFTHDGSSQLRYYALNALLANAKVSGNFHALIKEKDDLKIDGLVGAVIGYDELAALPAPKESPKAASWDEILAELEAEEGNDYA